MRWTRLWMFALVAIALCSMCGCDMGLVSRQSRDLSDARHNVTPMHEWFRQARALIDAGGGSGRDTKIHGGHFKVKKKYKKFVIPLLLAYKLKFFTLIPVVIGGLVLLTGATGLAGFFFALFAASMGLKSGHHY